MWAPCVREVAFTLPGSSAAPGEFHMPLTASPALPTDQLSDVSNPASSQSTVYKGAGVEDARPVLRSHPWGSRSLGKGQMNCDQNQGRIFKEALTGTLRKTSEFNSRKKCYQEKMRSSPTFGGRLANGPLGVSSESSARDGGFGRSGPAEPGDPRVTRCSLCGSLGRRPSSCVTACSPACCSCP